MKIGFDYWQVISHYPDYFKKLAEMHRDAGDYVYVISAVGQNRAGSVLDAVRKLGFLHEPVREVVFEDPKQSPSLKLEACQEIGIEVFYDDRDDVCRLLNKNGILALRVTRKDNSTYDLEAEIK
jgi:acid phosphatase class B